MTFLLWYDGRKPRTPCLVTRVWPVGSRFCHRVGAVCWPGHAPLLPSTRGLSEGDGRRVNLNAALSVQSTQGRRRHNTHTQASPSYHHRPTYHTACTWTEPASFSPLSFLLFFVFVSGNWRLFFFRGWGGKRRGIDAMSRRKLGSRPQHLSAIHGKHQARWRNGSCDQVGFRLLLLMKWRVQCHRRDTFNITYGTANACHVLDVSRNSCF